VGDWSTAADHDVIVFSCTINDGGRKGSNANAVPPPVLDTTKKKSRCEI